MSTKIELIIPGRQKDLGGFQVRRVLPFASHRMVGPFIFFDHMGPVQLQAGEGMNIRPHPHVNLATVTFLFEGQIRHRDSLGSDVIIEPGAVNWMIAGRGIVHSERTPKENLSHTNKVNGIQLWVAVPEKDEEMAPLFSHHDKNSLPETMFGKSSIKVILGSAFGLTSPVPILSQMFYAQAQIPANENILFKSEGQETAVYVASGKVFVDDQLIEPYSMAVIRNNEDVMIRTENDSHVMLLGGKPVGLRHIYWNFVSSSKERIETCKKDWLTGPHKNNQRFFPIPGDDQEFTPLPIEP